MKIVLDTETCNGFTNPLVYDLGWVVATDEGGIIKERSYVIKEIFDNKKLFETAYYKEKRPLYLMRLKTGYSKKVAYAYAMRQLTKDMQKYNVTKLAYNSRFDNNSIAKTMKFLHKEKWNPLTTEIDDIMKYISPITSAENYVNFCKENGFMTKHKTPRPQRKAETLYCYLTNNPNYKEEHTALEDSKIELQIYAIAQKLQENE